MNDETRTLVDNMDGIVSMYARNISKYINNMRLYGEDNIRIKSTREALDGLEKAIHEFRTVLNEVEKGVVDPKFQGRNLDRKV